MEWNGNLSSIITAATKETKTLTIRSNPAAQQTVDEGRAAVQHKPMRSLCFYVLFSSQRGRHPSSQEAFARCFVTAAPRPFFHCQMTRRLSFLGLKPTSTYDLFLTFPNSIYFLVPNKS
jgi:hypothetical protein